MGVYSFWAEKYFESGYSVLPVDPKTKACYINEWTKIFSYSLPDQKTIDSIISLYKDHDIGLACGQASGVIGIDFDYTGEFAKEIEEKILGILPPTPIAKKGAKGWTRFYKWSEEIINRGIDRGDKRMVDILSTGRLTVLPPSSHKSGMNYKWLTEDDLLNYNTNDLPILTLSMVSAICDIALIDNHFFHENKNIKSGRANKIFGFVYQRSNISNSLEDLIKETLEYDKIEIGKDPKGPYFEDKKYNKGKTPLEFCSKEVSRYIEYKKRRRLEKYGEIWDIGSNIDFPTKQNGFFSKIQKLDSRNNPIFDSNDEPVFREVADHIGMADYLSKVHSLAVTKSFAYQYEDQYYKVVCDMQLRNMIFNLSKKKAGKNHIENFRAIIRANCFKTDDYFKEPDGLINLKNGILQVKSRKLLPHDPKYFFKYKLNHDYNSSAECPEWIKFLKFIFNDDQELIDLLQEIFGYAMSGGDPWLHKAFMFLGEGRNGKSTVLDVLKLLLGADNYSSVPIQNFGEPFSVVMVDGKLANIIGETTAAQMSSEFFKIAVSGEEIIASHKGLPQYPMKFKAKIFFAANQLPKFKDSTAGAFEKLCIIPFNIYIKESKRIPKYAEKILFKEISGIVNWALIGLDRLLKRERLTNPKRVKESLKDYRIVSDSVFDWVSQAILIGNDQIDAYCKEKNIIINSQNGQKISQFYENYKQFCIKKDRPYVSQIGFSRKVLQELKRNEDVILSYPNNAAQLDAGAYIIGASLSS